MIPSIESIKKIVLDSAVFAKKENVEIFEKGSEVNIVTSADIAVQKYLEKELTTLLPGSGFLGEESDPENANNEYCWIVDPIDGTQNFARSMNQSGICVALRHQDEVIKSVVYNPFLNDLFLAEKGKGSYLNGRKLKVSNTDFAHGLLFTAMSLYNKSYAKTCNDIIMDAYYQCNDVRRFGVASLELCYIADGRADLYFEYRLFPWDYAAASLILTEAGGIIGSPVDGTYSLSLPCPVIAANNQANYDKLKAICCKYMHNVPYRD